jgi:hypothetical protein
LAGLKRLVAGVLGTEVLFWLQHYWTRRTLRPPAREPMLEAHRREIHLAR